MPVAPQVIQLLVTLDSTYETYQVQKVCIKASAAHFQRQMALFRAGQVSVDIRKLPG